MTEKFDAVLRYFGERAAYFGDQVRHNDADWPMLKMTGKREFDSLVNALSEDGAAHVDSLGVTLTRNGWARVDELRRTGPESNNAFVAMSFDPNLNDLYDDGISPALREDCGYEPIRMDKVRHGDLIGSRIIADIRASRIVVADVSEPSLNVYYEAGFAKGIGRPVIYTCREGSKLPFDTSQYQHIYWKDPGHLRKELADWIQAEHPLPESLRRRTEES